MSIKFLSENQRKDICKNRLSYADIKRIAKYIKVKTVEDDCILWDGYINCCKGRTPYINFYFNSKKVALHRLLYHNYVEELKDNEYLKYTCINKGKCCNYKHLKKFNYKNKKKNISTDRKKGYRVEKGKIILSFD